MIILFAYKKVWFKWFYNNYTVTLNVFDYSTHTMLKQLPHLSRLHEVSQLLIIIRLLQELLCRREVKAGGHSCDRYRSGFVITTTVSVLPRRSWQSVCTTRAGILFHLHIWWPNHEYISLLMLLLIPEPLLYRTAAAAGESRGRASNFPVAVLRGWPPRGCGLCCVGSLPAAWNIPSLVWSLLLKQHIWTYFLAICFRPRDVFLPLEQIWHLVVTNSCHRIRRGLPRGVKNQPPVEEWLAFWRHVSAHLVKSLFSHRDSSGAPLKIPSGSTRISWPQKVSRGGGCAVWVSIMDG